MGKRVRGPSSTFEGPHTGRAVPPGLRHPAFGEAREGRSPLNLRREEQVLRFGLGLFSALAFLEGERWPLEPAARQWAVTDMGLPVLAGGEAPEAEGAPGRAHAALLYRLLTGRVPPPEGPWPSVPRRHAAFALWNRWFSTVSGDADRSPACRSLLLDLWALADETDHAPSLPAGWGLGVCWEPGVRVRPGLQSLAAPAGFPFDALRDWASTSRSGMRQVPLGDGAPYPFASLEPLAAAALGDAAAGREWMREHVAGGGEGLAEGLARLLSTAGGWVLWPSRALGRESLACLREACSALEVPVVLLDHREGLRAGRVEAIRLLWLPLVTEEWYLENVRALAGKEPDALLSLLQGLPDSHPRCGSPVLPPLPGERAAPVAGAQRGGDPAELARRARSRELWAWSGGLGDDGGGDGAARFWSGAALLLAGQPHLALSRWEGLDEPSLRGELALWRARACDRLQDYAGAGGYLRAAGRAALGAPGRAAALLLEGQLAWVRGDRAAGEATFAAAVAEDPSPDVRVQSLCHRAMAALHGAEPERAGRLLSEAREAMPADALPLTRFLLCHREAVALRKGGRFAEAGRGFLAAREEAAAHGMRDLEAWCDCEVGNTLRRDHRFEEALAHYGRAREGAAGLGLRKLEETARFDLAVCRVEAGDLTPAWREFEASIAREGARRTPLFCAVDHYWLAVVHHQTGDIPSALEVCERGLEALGPVRDPEVRLPLLTLRGELLLATGQHRKLTALLQELGRCLGPGTDPDDALAAAALRCAAAAKGVGAFVARDAQDALALMPLASPYFQAHWRLLSARSDGDLATAWEAARSARSAHLASRALWALAERGALPRLSPEESGWVASFLTRNRIRGPERALLPLLDAGRSGAEPRTEAPPSDLDFLHRALEGDEASMEEVLQRAGADAACRVQPGRPPLWWGRCTADQRRRLAEAAGLKGQAPSPGGTLLGCPGAGGLWCGFFRVGSRPYTTAQSGAARLWTLLWSERAAEGEETAPPPAHPAIERLLLTRSPAMGPVLGSLQRAASYHFPVLITGEPGVGKEVCARALHAASSRAARAMVTANCANLTPTLAVSLLFGHRRGAFTGADRDHPGLAEAARGGTLFLDEVGELPSEVQPHLLRYLQDGTYLPLGETRVRESDARIVAATNRDLAAAVARGLFREDLYHRLNVIPVEIPPLRQRPEDIPMLFGHFLHLAAGEEGVPVPGVAPEVVTRLAAYPWPGNVRELQNVARALLVASHGGSAIKESHLPPRLVTASDRRPTTLAARLLEEERRAVAEALRDEGGNVSAAARNLGVSRQSLHQKVRRLGLAGVVRRDGSA